MGTFLTLATILCLTLAGLVGASEFAGTLRRLRAPRHRPAGRRPVAKPPRAHNPFG